MLWLLDNCFLLLFCLSIFDNIRCTELYQLLYENFFSIWEVLCGQGHKAILLLSHGKIFVHIILF